MKFPHVTLAALAAMLALSSCDVDHYRISNAKPQTDTSATLRCCDGDVLLDDPLFIDIYSMIHVGLVEPGTTLFDALDSSYIIFVFDELVACLEDTEDYLQCLDGFNFLLSVKGYLENYGAIDSLKSELAENYQYLNEDEFNSAFLDAVGTMIMNEYNNLPAEKKVPCYEEYQKAVVIALTDFAAGIIQSDVTAIAYVFRDLAMAKYDFCNCLYNTYGYNC